MIFAAGLGTRLYPITKDKPKALVKIHNKPLLEILIRRLIQFGFDEIIVNIHHFAEKVITFLQTNNNFGIDIRISNETDYLLDTGGGLKKASGFFNDNKPFLVQNVDVISDIDYIKLLDYHNTKDALATLAVRNRKTSRYLLFDKNNQLCGWENVNSGEKIIVHPNQELKQLAFSGIHIIDPKIFNHIDQKGKFSIIDVYLKLAQNYNISGYQHNENLWIDLGRKEHLSEGENIYSKIKGN